MESTNLSTYEQDEITLKEFIEFLYRGRWLIVWVTLICTVAAMLLAVLTPKTYKATTVISPVSDSADGQLGGLSGLASQFGGLASLAGISVSGDSKKSESLAILQSQALTEKYIAENNLLAVLYHDKWDADNKKWKASNTEKIPTLWKANEYFKRKIRAVSSDTKTGLVTLTISWKDPKVAAQWANDLVKMTNDYLRSKALEQSERNIAYLNEQAIKTDAVAVKEAIYSILQTEINKAMVARGTDEYAFKVLDPAVAPERPASPNGLLWILGGLMGGLALSAFITFVRMAWR